MFDQDTPALSTAGETRVTHNDDAPRKRGKGKPFSSESARKAAQVSAEKRRLKRQAEEAGNATGSASDATRVQGGDGQSGMAASGLPSSAPPVLGPGDIAVQTPVAAAAVMQALERAAVAGDAQAAGTLLRWTQAYPAIDTAVRLDQLSEETRDQLLARLLRELAEHEAAVAAGEGRQTGG